MSLIVSALAAMLASKVSEDRHEIRKANEGYRIAVHHLDSDDELRTKESRERVYADPECYPHGEKRPGWWYPDRRNHPIWREYCYKEEWIQKALKSCKMSYSLEELQGWNPNWGHNISEEITEYCHANDIRVPSFVKESTYYPTGKDELRNRPRIYWKEKEREESERTGKFKDDQAFIPTAIGLTVLVLACYLLAHILYLLGDEFIYPPWVSWHMLGATIATWIICTICYFTNKRWFERKWKITHWKPGDPIPK